MYKVPYSHLGGRFIKSAGEEYQVGKRGKEDHGCEEEYNVKNGGSNIIITYNIKFVKKNIK